MPLADPAAAPLAAADFAAFANETQRFLRVCGADEALATDLCQEALLLAVRKRVTFPTPHAARAWLRRTARYLLLATRRRPERVAAVDPVWLDAVERHFDGLASEHAWLDAVRACTERVHGRARRALQLVYGEQFTYPEAATALGLSPNGIKTLLRRVRRTLRACIERRMA